MGSLALLPLGAQCAPRARVSAQHLYLLLSLGPQRTMALRQARQIQPKQTSAALLSPCEVAGVVCQVRTRW